MYYKHSMWLTVCITVIRNHAYSNEMILGPGILTVCFPMIISQIIYTVCFPGTYKVRNEIETKRNEINENETKRNEINKNETKRNEINEMKTK